MPAPPRTVNPSVAIQAQVACAEWWSTNAGFEAIANLYATLESLATGVPVPELIERNIARPEAHVRQLVEIARLQALDVYEAAPFYVDTPIVDGLVAASASLPDEVPIGLSQFPAPRGYAYLASNTLRIPVWGSLAGRPPDVVRALSWAPVALEPEQMVHPDGTPDPNRVRFCLNVWVDRGWPNRRTTLFADETETWRVGDRLTEGGDPDRVRAHSRSQTRELAETLWRFLLTLGAFVHEQLVLDTAEPADRLTRRMMARKGLPELPRIRTIQLRQRERQEHPKGHRDVDWSCSWLVSSHWRRQWHPSTREHRWRPIPAYVKGPPDKPFKVSGPALRSVVR